MLQVVEGMSTNMSSHILRMDNVKIVSYNCRDFNDMSKRSGVFEYLKSLYARIFCQKKKDNAKWDFLVLAILIQEEYAFYLKRVW